MEGVSVQEDGRSWVKTGRCYRHRDPDLWFSEDQRRQGRAKSLCQSCPVREPCLAYALAHDFEWGVWGGLTAHERGELRRVVAA